MIAVGEEERRHYEEIAIGRENILELLSRIDESSDDVANHGGILRVNHQ